MFCCFHKIDYHFSLRKILWFCPFSCSLLAVELSIPYGVGDWPENDRGNHRAVIEVSSSGSAVAVDLPWRRRDTDPETKAVRIYSSSGQLIENVLPLRVERESGNIVFEPLGGPGKYYLYYLPYDEPQDWAGDAGSYFKPENTASDAWLKQVNAATELPKATVIAFESRTQFDSMFPMEIPATTKEMNELLTKYKDKRCLIFPAAREFPIRMKDELPWRWIETGPANSFAADARPNEYFAFQLGVFAIEAVQNITLEVNDLATADGTLKIAADAISCVNLGGSDPFGKDFVKVVNVPAGAVQPLWILVRIPKDACGIYSGKFRLASNNMKPEEINITLNVSGEALAEHGFADIYNMSRIAWLDSKRGIDDTVLPPYTPIESDGNSMRVLDRKLEFSASGLPISVVSRDHELCSLPPEIIIHCNGKFEKINWGTPKIVNGDKTSAEASNHGVAESGDFEISWTRVMRYQGEIIYKYTLTAINPIILDNATMRFPLLRKEVPLAMGMALRGGTRPENWLWKKGEKGTEHFWLGNPNAGIQWQMLGDFDSAQMNSPDADNVIFEMSTGPNVLEPDKSMQLNFKMLVTPFHRIDPRHWSYRYETQWGGDTGGWNMSLLFHGDRNCGNTYINYPFIEETTMREFVRVKYKHAAECQDNFYAKEETPEDRHPTGYTPVLYYTVRELSNHAAESWVMRSLGNEVFKSSATITAPDGSVIKNDAAGHPWLKEHFITDYAPAWRMPIYYPDGRIFNDASFAINDLTRWQNYYVEGCDWVIRHCGIRGIYLDGIGFPSEVLERIAKVMYLNFGDYYVNFHGGNDYDSSWLPMESQMSKRMEHLAWLNNLWFGEIFSYDRDPDYWMVEISGIPFGLTSEMLNYENGGNPYRGMVYGMNGRILPGCSAMWMFWDEFKIHDAEWIGYWEDNCPVKTDRNDIRLSVYKKPGQSMIAFAHWPQMGGKILDLPRSTPGLNGKLNSTWDEAASGGKFEYIGGKGVVPDTLETKVKVTRDDKFLYIGFECMLDRKPQAKIVKRDGEVWSDDSVDIFLETDKTQIHFIGNALGTIWDIKNSEASWNGNWNYSAVINDNSWSGTVALPLAEFGPMPDVIKAQLCRTSYATSGYTLSSWSPANQYSDSASFGTFVLNGSTESRNTEYSDNSVLFNIDWNALGLDPKKAIFRCPPIDKFQEGREFKINERIPFEQAKGGILIIEEKQ